MDKLKLLKSLRMMAIISFVIKSNIALGLAWYGQFYGDKLVYNSASPFSLGATASLCVAGILCLIISENKNG